MKIAVTAFAMLGVVAASAHAHANPSLDAMLGGEDPALTKDELATLAALQRNRPDDIDAPRVPIVDVDDTVYFRYGGPDPRLLCSPVEGCDVRLQAGEIVQDSSNGDTRWTVDVLFEGTPPNEIPHLVITPHDIGLQTLLVVTTNRRTYHIFLKSHSSSTTPKCAFHYSEEIRARFAAAHARQEAMHSARATEMKRTTLADGIRVSDLVFDYDIRGRAPWKPVRVYNDGSKTFIQFPPAVTHTELPTFVLRRTHGDLFHDGELVRVNTHYDPDQRRLTVDCVFDEAELLAGVGHDQLRVVILRLPPTR